jgi:DNA polymerase-3 subunit delta
VATEISLQFNKIMQDLKAKKFSPVYVLHGEETYFVDVITSYIEHNALAEHERGFNQTVFYAKDTEPNQVIESARRFPMMADKQLIVVKEAQGFKSLDAFENYLLKPVPTTILVISVKGKKLDKRTKFYKLADKHIAFESARLYEKDLLPWIKSYVQTHGYTINDKSIALIADSLGSDLSKIANELDKLFINKTGADKDINDNDIEKYIGISKEFNSYELLAAIAAKNSHRAFKIAHHLSKNKDFSIIPFIAIANGMFAKAYIIAKTNTRDKKTIQTAFGLGYYQADDYVNLVKNYSMVELERIIALCAQFDLKSKGINSIALGNEEILKDFLVRLFR